MEFIQHISRIVTEKDQKLKKGQRLPKSRNSDWNDVVEDLDKNVFFKVYGAMDRELGSKSLQKKSISDRKDILA